MEKLRGLNGATLKWIAIIIMAIDHAGAALMEPILLSPSGQYVEVVGITLSLAEFYNVYMFIRAIGRTAFPIFAYLIVEGYCHTKSKGKYIRNMLLAGLISEIPFDLAIFRQMFDLEHQNVMFTLAIGVMMLWAIESVMTRLGDRFSEYLWLPQTVQLLIAAAFMAFAELVMHTDYGYVGVLCIYVIYYTRPRKVLGVSLAVLLLTLMNGLEIYAIPAILFVKLYNGTRGKQNKYFFYLFYPVHLLLLFFIAYSFIY
ncbi:MAG: TraX family protein [Lachnospiraceae bacterium]